MDLALNNLQRLIYHKTQTSKLEYLTEYYSSVLQGLEIQKKIEQLLLFTRPCKSPW